MSRTSRLAFALLLTCTSLSPAAAAVYVFSSPMTGAQEVPPVVTPGTGFVTVTFDDVANTLQVETSWQDLIGTTTLAHIHVIPPGSNAGPPATTVPTWPGFPTGTTSGTFTGTLDLSLASSYNPSFLAASSGTPASAEAALLAAMLEGRTYFNIHTTAFGGGEIRGNLALVPEPGTWMLMLGGFAAAGMALRRRRAKELVPA